MIASITEAFAGQGAAIPPRRAPLVRPSGKIVSKRPMDTANRTLKFA